MVAFELFRRISAKWSCGCILWHLVCLFVNLGAVPTGRGKERERERERKRDRERERERKRDPRESE